MARLEATAEIVEEEEEIETGLEDQKEEDGAESSLPLAEEQTCTGTPPTPATRPMLTQLPILKPLLSPRQVRISWNLVEIVIL